MFTLSVETQNFRQLVDIHHFFNEETNKSELLFVYDQLDEYIELIPEQFQDAIKNRQFLEDNELIKLFVAWCYETTDAINGGKSREELYADRELILNRFDEDVKRLLLKSFHDGKLLVVKEEAGKVHILLDMSGGFTTESIIKLTFHEATFEGVLQGYYLYDELIEIDGKYGLRILSSFGSPNVQATIYFSSISVEYLYRPGSVIERAIFSTWEDYVASLNTKNRYFIVKELDFIEIDVFRACIHSNGIYVNDVCLGETLEAAIDQIYCETYDDPFAKYSIPLREDELFDAILGSDPERRARAMNTVTSSAGQFSDIVNEVLRRVPGKTYEDLTYVVLLNYLEKHNCVDDDIKQKWA